MPHYVGVDVQHRINTLFKEISQVITQFCDWVKNTQAQFTRVEDWNLTVGNTNESPTQDRPRNFWEYSTTVGALKYIFIEFKWSPTKRIRYLVSIEFIRWAMIFKTRCSASFYTLQQAPKFLWENLKAPKIKWPNILIKKC